MTITFPEWYTGTYPNVDRVLCWLLQPYLNDVGPVAPQAMWERPADYLTPPAVLCYRQLGPIDPETLMDHAVAYMGVIAADPADDWALAGFCREVLFAHRDGGTVFDPDGNPYLIGSVQELEGPEQVPDFDPALRITPTTWHVTLPRPRTVPDYRVELGIR